ncbi:hypothetical protein DFH07DRAFT_980560 [Mycena maculata]|uniref:Uncharacterized protein n=1 Tax=Mycena maculata TaxID=230809 RepID=A0AAD7IHS1_9AGAR|nr:hypothetical protein DFH07DRAFT_980560 [Mycena maculata]
MIPLPRQTTPVMRDVRTTPPFYSRLKTPDTGCENGLAVRNACRTPVAWQASLDARLRSREIAVVGRIFCPASVFVLRATQSVACGETAAGQGLEDEGTEASEAIARTGPVRCYLVWAARLGVFFVRFITKHIRAGQMSREERAQVKSRCSAQLSTSIIMIRLQGEITVVLLISMTLMKLLNRQWDNTEVTYGSFNLNFFNFAGGSESQPRNLCIGSE